MPYLIQKNTDGTTAQQWLLTDVPAVFGRGSEENIKIDDAEISKRHFQITRRGETYLISDLKSANGTWLNDQRLAGEQELKPGAKIRAGRTLFVFEKGVGTVIGELMQEQKSYSTVLREVVKDTERRPRQT